MNLTVLIDNVSEACSTLVSEHGLSMYFEIDNYKWLMDVGASDKFYHNAKELGIDLCEVDFLVLSHAHKDHTGGLAHFLKINHKAKVYLAARIEDNLYYSTRRGLKRDISMDNSLLKENPEQFIPISSNTELSSNVTLICNICQEYPTPKANKTLMVNNSLDTFNHEIFLLVNTSKGKVILSACSHHGILNTLAACGTKDIIAYIGGTHLIDSDKTNVYEDKEELKHLAQQIVSLYPNLSLITGHCTGKEAQKVFSEMMDKFEVFYSGYTCKF